MDDESEENLSYYHGQVFAMVGANFDHNRICTNLLVHFASELADKCHALGASMRVQAESQRHYTYPDVAVVCGEPEFLDEEKESTLANPVLIAEVLSKSTGSFDRGDKFASYRKICTLRHYLMVSQYEIKVEHFFKNDSGRWELEEQDSLEGVLRFSSLGCDLPVENIYKGVGKR